MFASDRIHCRSKPFLIGIVVASFMDTTLILKCVDSILATGDREIQVMVVDCMSNELPKIFAERYASKVSLIQLDYDPGVAEQRNIGFRNLANNSAFTFFLDNDTELQKDTIKEISKTMTENPQFSIFQPRIVSCSNKNTTLEIGLSSDVFGIPKPIRDGKTEPFFASGSAMVVRTDLLTQIGGFDSVLQFGAEELDLVWRARLQGHVVKPVPDAIVCHRTQGTRNRLNSKRLHLGLRNTLRMLLKNYSFPRNFLLATILIAKSGVESVILLGVSKITGKLSNVATLTNGQNSFLNLVIAFVGAILWNITNIGDTITQHKQIQATRTVNEKVIQNSMRRADLIFVSPAYNQSARASP